MDLYFRVGEDQGSLQRPSLPHMQSVLNRPALEEIASDPTYVPGGAVEPWHACDFDFTPGGLHPLLSCPVSEGAAFVTKPERLH